MRFFLVLLSCFFLANGALAQEPAVKINSPYQIKPDRQFLPFTCYSNYFKVQVPADWKLYEDITAADAEKVYGMDVKGPANKDGAFTSITVLYYGPDHLLFKSPEEFIKANSTPKGRGTAEKFERVTPADVAGKKASRIDRHVFLTLPSRKEAIPMHELLFVLPVEKGGFFVLEYSSAEDVFDKYVSIFDVVLATFKPLH